MNATLGIWNLSGRQGHFLRVKGEVKYKMKANRGHWFRPDEMWKSDTKFSLKEEVEFTLLLFYCAVFRYVHGQWQRRQRQERKKWTLGLGSILWCSMRNAKWPSGRGSCFPCVYECVLYIYFQYMLSILVSLLLTSPSALNFFSALSHLE